MPLGCALGYGLVQVMSHAFKTELFRIEPVVEPQTLGVALAVTLSGGYPDDINRRPYE